MNPHVKSIQFKDDYCLLLTFENGEKCIFDLKPYFDKPVFAKLKKHRLIQNRARSFRFSGMARGN